MPRNARVLLLAGLVALAGSACEMPAEPSAACYEVSTVVINPTSVTLDAIGETANLTATVFDSVGNRLSNVAMTWRSLNTAVATVTQDGTVIARGVGTALLVAAAGSCTPSDSAAVVVHQLVSPPAAPGQLNEPAGMTTFFRTDGTQRDFGSSWSTTAKWLNDRYTQVVADATNPTGSGKAIEKRWYAGENMDNGGGLTTLSNFSNVGGFPSRVLYVRLRVKFSPNYDTDANYGGMKFGYWGIQGGGVKYFTWIDTDGMRPLARLGAENPTQSHFGSTRFKTGVWHTLEFVQTAQSARGVGDGRFQWWVDGVLQVDAQNQSFSTQYGPLLNSYQLFFIRGKSGMTFKIDDWVRIGELYISGKQ